MLKEDELFKLKITPRITPQGLNLHFLNRGQVMNFHFYFFSETSGQTPFGNCFELLKVVDSFEYKGLVFVQHIFLMSHRWLSLLFHISFAGQKEK